MLKCDEIEHAESCFNKAKDKERLFVLLARDPAAPVAIRAWVAERLRLGKNGPSDSQIVEALDCAERMEAERSEVVATRGQQQLHLTSHDASVADSVRVSFLSSTTAPAAAVSLTWQGLAAMLAEPRRTSCTTATCKGSQCSHKEGECWSPAVFRFNRRHAEDVDAISCLVLDVDHVSDAVIEDVRARLVDYQHLIHTTHADRPGDRCMRIVVQLSIPVIASEWSRFWGTAVTVLGIPTATACGDSARCWYLPSRPSDADYFAVVHAGKPLDVVEMLAHASSLRDPAARSSAQEGVSL